MELSPILKSRISNFIVGSAIVSSVSCFLIGLDIIRSKTKPEKETPEKMGPCMS